MPSNFAIIEDGKVVNIALSDAPLADNWVASDVAQIGWLYDGVVFTEPPLPVPASISFAQLLIGLVTEQWITEADGEGWLIGTLPAAVTAVIDTLPEGQRFAAKARALRPSEVVRADPLVAAMGLAAGKTEAQIDTFFRTYAQV